MSQPVRIAFVLSKYAVGGVEKQLAKLIAYRPPSARDVEVHTITFLPASSSEVEQQFDRGGAHNTLVDRRAMSFPRFFVALVQAMWRLRPMVVSTLLDSSTGTWGRLAAWLARVPVIVHSDRLLATEGTRAHDLLRPFLDRVTTRFLPNANAIAERLVATGVPRERIVVMPNGVDLSVFDPDAVPPTRTQWGVADGDTVLGFLGRFALQKRVDLLLDALAKLPEDVRPDYVVLAGEGPTMGDARATVEADPWLRERCRFLGRIHDTPAFLANLDYLVLPSDSEGLPNVVLEAMAMAKPVIATAVSDVPDLIGDTGFVVEPGNALALADAIRRMQGLTDDERRDLGSRARQRVEQEYDIVVRAAHFWDAHLSLLATTNTSGEAIT